VGKTVTVRVLRDGKEVERAVKIGEMEGESKTATANSSSQKSLGVAVQNLTPQIARELGLKRKTGVVVTAVEPGSAAAEATIQTGDVIREVNRKPVGDVDDFAQKIEQAKGQESILFLIQRGQNTLFAAVTPR
jgi:serine protease Do